MHFNFISELSTCDSGDLAQSVSTVNPGAPALLHTHFPVQEGEAEKSTAACLVTHSMSSAVCLQVPLRSCAVLKTDCKLLETVLKEEKSHTHALPAHPPGKCRAHQPRKIRGANVLRAELWLFLDGGRGRGLDRALQGCDGRAGEIPSTCPELTAP